MEPIAYPCPSCSAEWMARFYQVKGVPVHSVVLVRSRAEALAFPKGDIDLAFCQNCGFVTNIAFDAGLQDYAADYESTQACSPTFNRFHQRLATTLIERYDLRQKDIIEIGCGQGEFLNMLCELGDNRGVGFDPAFVGEPGDDRPSGHQIIFVADYYSEKYRNHQADFVCCKMTLEHIHNTADFVGTVRRAIGHRPDTVVFFQVPNARYVFGDLAFWDVYYEHCSYFSLGSMARLFRNSGFKVMNLWTDYGNQYLMIEARPGLGMVAKELPQENDLEMLSREIDHFAASYRPMQDKWRRDIAALRAAGRRLVLWGGGSKAVSFLTTLGLSLDDIEYVVDINPKKAGTFLAGAGQETVTPDFLSAYRPDTILIMNPIYRQEIKESLASLGLNPELLTV